MTVQEYLCIPADAVILETGVNTGGTLYAVWACTVDGKGNIYLGFTTKGSFKDEPTWFDRLVRWLITAPGRQKFNRTRPSRWRCVVSRLGRFMQVRRGHTGYFLTPTMLADMQTLSLKACRQGERRV
jgi:hypothetical protein